MYKYSKTLVEGRKNLLHPWFNQLSFPFNELAKLRLDESLKNDIEWCHNIMHTYNSLSEAIQMAFDFELTPESHAFWNTIHHKNGHDFLPVQSITDLRNAGINIYLNPAELKLEPIIRTYSGQMVNILNPDPDTIRIEDIAHALSLMPRFGGHTNVFYSVAQHSRWCARYCDKTFKKYAFEALMHDASEAYMMDIPSPIKQLLPEYKVIENRLMEVIAKKYGFNWPMPKEVETADKAALYDEMERLWQKEYPKNSADQPMFPQVAEQYFLKAFYELCREELPGNH